MHAPGKLRRLRGPGSLKRRRVIGRFGRLWPVWWMDGPFKWPRYPVWCLTRRDAIDCYQAGEVFKMPKRISPAVNVDVPPLQGIACGEAGDLFPLLCGWLCDGVYDDGSIVGDVRLTIRRAGGHCIAELKVQDGALKLRAVEATPTAAVMALEALLAADRPPWEPDAYPVERPTKKRK